MPGFEIDLWFILAAPAKVPKAFVNKISADVQKVLMLPDVVKAFEVTGVVTVPRSAAETQKFVARELKTFGEAARAANVPTF